MAAEELDISVPSCLHMVSAFLAMEPPHVVISFAREFGGGSITDTVQTCIWHRCISKADLKWQGPYLKKFLKKFISEIESSGGIVLDELYEQYASYMVSLQLHWMVASFGCALEARFLFDLSLGCLCCYIGALFGRQVGSGVGLVGICLAYVKASKVILSDGDLSTLANLKANLELNHLSTENHALDNLVHHNAVHCVCLPWESASEDDLRRFVPDIILGADIIYNPSCLPYLVRVLAVLLNHKHSQAEVGADRELNNSRGRETSNGEEVVPHHPWVKGRVAYVASVIRNIDTFNYFLELAQEANLVVTDLTQNVQLSNFLPYLRSYHRDSIRIFRIHESR
ncbi:hypothetical protein BUALT_Bualt03G0027600 [Buddleja alternifolia]|uniref:Uncharacterized protein n=1 Tax=Buddleja alternifolia TaxID=168488 RepID=A0AAV6Y1J2_9LAMI|nr:hypothetical protein BUALT_Bualt03G0027600 [Buddleja alternifolia]